MKFYRFYSEVLECAMKTELAHIEYGNNKLVKLYPGKGDSMSKITRDQKLSKGYDSILMIHK